MNIRPLKYILILALLNCSLISAAQTTLTQKLQAKLDSACKVGKVPGLSVAIAYPDNTVIALASGVADSAKNQPLTPSARMMQGSVGKTYASAVAMQLIKEGKFSLDDKVSKYLGHYAWYSRLPNATDITIKQLMQHTSGIMRYEFKDTFTKDLTAQPKKVWKPEELLAYVLDEKAPFKAGEGWDYSDTNYIILAMIMEQVTGKSYYAMVADRLLKPYGLTNTLPSNKIKLPGLVQGYAGNDNPFGGRSQVIAANGEFIINPQFEWTGGGIYSTTSDLAKWGELLYRGKVLDTATLRLMETGVPARMLGATTSYGLGVIIKKSPIHGTLYGHSGFFPGYMTELYYFPKYDVTIAVQTNSSDFKSLKMSLTKVLMEIAGVIAATPK
jgi:D-alanyl-D-alanine carboxypeptidase